MPEKLKYRKRGEEPPNELGMGMTGSVSQSEKICQLWEWCLHRGRDFFQLPTHKVQEEDLTYAIALPECCNDVVRA